jgi:hypothetical protein
LARRQPTIGLDGGPIETGTPTAFAARAIPRASPAWVIVIAVIMSTPASASVSIWAVWKASASPASITRSGE